MSTLSKFCVVALAVSVSACTVQDTPAPALTGPSEFALRIALQTTPDSIHQDGASQSRLIIEATESDGRPARGLPLRIEMVVDNVIQDYGTLSAKTVVTGDDGRATVIYTAPPKVANMGGDGVIVTFRVTPVGNNYRGEEARTIDLRLLPTGIILPPNAAPTSLFTFTPSAPQVLQTVVFDASGSTDEGAACPSCSFTWDFGDGGTGSGVFSTHTYRHSGTFAVTLTVSDARGAVGVSTQAINVSSGPPPTAAFTFSPTEPAPGQRIFFTAAASRAAAGKTIVEFDWDFGDGTFGGGVQTSKVYNTPGTYVVTLVVEDDAGEESTVSQTIQVGTATGGGGGGTGPTAALTVTPGSGTTATNFVFDASSSTGSPTQYQFSFGDGSPDVVGTQPTTAHRYSAAGTYTATVVVRDSANRTSTRTVTLTVTA
jgi:PKD repeat protein